MTIPLSLLLTHFLSDFLLQTDWMALNKSKSNEALTLHALTYATPFALFGFRFAVYTFLTHWITDYFTSRCTTKLWFFREVPSYYEDEIVYAPIPSRRHWFFVMIGFDQLIHAFTLATTYWMLS